MKTKNYVEITHGDTVKFVNDYYKTDCVMHTTTFRVADPESALSIIRALSTHYSGDPYRCFVNDEEIELVLDHGPIVVLE